MIKSFKNKTTEKVYHGERVRKLADDIQRRAQRKLVLIDAAVELNDLATPPGNRLEALSGDREGQHSIRVNKQWRICFVWAEDSAWHVELTDYH